MYQRFDMNTTIVKKIKFKVFLFLLIVLSISIIYVYVSNNSNYSNVRRKINNIEGDISSLFNYTETMSDFIVGNYIPPEVKLLEIIEKNKKDFDNYKNETSISIRKLIKSFEDYKNETSISINRNKNRNEAYLKKLALRYLASKFITKEQFFHFEMDFLMYSNSQDSNNLKKKLNNYYNITIEDYFEKMLNIDYDKFTVSFAYYSENEQENNKQNLIYKTISKLFTYDYRYIYNKTKINDDCSKVYNYYCLDNEYNYFKIEQIEKQIPFNGFLNTYFPSYKINYYNPSNGCERFRVIEKIYSEYEYMCKIFRFPFPSLSPQLFI